MNAAKKTTEKNPMNKKLIFIFVAAAIFILAIACFFTYQTGVAEKNKIGSPKKIKIIATLFPQYDFVRQIVKGRADVVLLLPPGVESHTYEPTPADIRKINEADVFVYTGKYMEQWAEKIISGAANKNLKIVDVSQNVKLSKSDEYDSEDETEHEKTKNSMEGAEHGSHHHLFDPHIWTDPNNAVIMTDNILAELCAADPENADYYRSNADAFKAELIKLDKDFRETVASGKRRVVIFGGRNAFHYFMKRYGLKCYAAHDSCSAEAEASVKKIAELMDRIKKDNIPVIYYEELTAPEVASAISSETGAKMLPFNSCHNVTKEEIENNATYISLMKENLKNLKGGLK
jgi:zinc transport system substrate-binding protein